MRIKLIFFVALIFLAGITCSSFAATMSISSALAITGNGVATPGPSKISTAISSNYFLFPTTFVYSIGTQLGTKSIAGPLPLPSQPPNNTTQPVPEPFTLVLLGSGLVGVYAARRKLS